MLKGRINYKYDCYTTRSYSNQNHVISIILTIVDDWMQKERQTGTA